ncbi:hypothetical protein [Burkholderia territorii]|uniref:hypothetical protein n=1 Tax=Burkholderia territorii TaxID=1503055 RepID=UPI0007583275|nr:hypothetical protein [Burkholderia territorii]KWA08761.1 hypothetical protein WT37_24775 [Burkholderia territorii]
MSSVYFPTISESRFAGDKFDRAFYGASENDGVVRASKRKGAINEAQRAAQKQWGRRFVYSTADAEQAPAASDMEGEGDE